MRQTGLYALVAVTIVAVVVAVLVSTGGGDAAVDPRIGKPVLPDTAQRIGDIARLTIVHGDNKTTLVKKGDAWGVEEKGGYAADPAKIRRTLLALAALSYAEPKTKKPDLYSRLDLDDPVKKGTDSRLVTLSDGKGQLIGEAIIGKHRYDMFGGGNDGVYVRRPGEPQSWLANGALDLPAETVDWLDRQITQLPLEQVKSATFTAADGSKVVIARDKPADKLALAGGIPAGNKLKSEGAIDDLGRALSYFDLDDVKPAADIKFPASGLATASYVSFDGMMVTITLFDQDKKHWAKITASGDNDAAKKAADALNAKLGPWVYGLPDFKAQAFSTKLPDLIEPDKAS